MPLTQTAPAVGNATLADHGIAWRDNDRIAGLPVVAGAPLLIGGSFVDFISGTGFIRLPNSPAFEIDGALAQYSTIYLEVDAIRGDDVGSTVSATFDLYNVTDAGTVAGSEITVSIDVAHPSTKHGKTSGFTLNSGVKRYHCRIKSPSNVNVAGWCKLVGKNS